MQIFRKTDEEIDEEEGSEDSPSRLKVKKVKDLNPQNRRKRKEPPKPWGKKERIIVLSILLVTVLTSAFLSLSSRGWKFPGIGRIEFPKLNFESSETIIIGTKKNLNEEANQKRKEKITNSFIDLTRNLTGAYNFYLFEVSSGNKFGLREKTKMQAASLIKLPVFATLYQEAQKGTIDLETKYTLKNSDKRGGSGSLQSKPSGTILTYRQLARYMGKESDNTAFNIFRNILGDEKIQSVIVKLGMMETSIKENETSAYDIGIFFEKLAKEEIVKKEYKDEIYEYLTDTIYEDWLAKGLPQDIKVAHKYGREENVVNDAGIILGEKPYILVILSEGIIYKEADAIFPALSQMVFENEK